MRTLGLAVRHSGGALTFDVWALSLSPEVKLFALGLSITACCIIIQRHPLGSGDQQLQLPVL